MAQGLHHIKIHSQKKHPGLLKFFDKSMYAIALVAPIMTIPQVIEVFQKHVQGVSLATWSAYTAVSFLWTMYGFLHNEKPIIVTNFLLFVCDSAIVVAVLLYH